MLKRRRHIAATEAERVAEDEQKCQVAMEREKWLIERARAVEVDPELLLPPPRSRAGRQSADSGLGWMGDETDLEQEPEQYSQAEDEGIGDPHVGAPETKGLQLMSEQGEVLMTQRSSLACYSYRPSSIFTSPRTGRTVCHWPGGHCRPTPSSYMLALRTIGVTRPGWRS